MKKRILIGLSVGFMVASLSALAQEVQVVAVNDPHDSGSDYLKARVASQARSGVQRPFTGAVGNAAPGEQADSYLGKVESSRHTPRRYQPTTTTPEGSPAPN